MWMTIVLWLAFGFTLSWKKGQRGPIAEWIGALIRPWQGPNNTHGVTITIPADKFEKLGSFIQHLLDNESQVPKAELRSFIGLMTWVANICPQCNAFCRMLWGALTADSKIGPFLSRSGFHCIGCQHSCRIKRNHYSGTSAHPPRCTCA